LREQEGPQPLLKKIKFKTVSGEYKYKASRNKKKDKNKIRAE
jgi:hypothetical protein